MKVMADFDKSSCTGVGGGESLNGLSQEIMQVEELEMVKQVYTTPSRGITAEQSRAKGQ